MIAAFPAAAPERRQVILAIGLVTASTLCFSISDVTAKFLTASLPPLQVVWLRYLVFCLLILPVALARLQARPAEFRKRSKTQFVRALTMAGSAILFTSGLQFLPLADATAISFIAPIFVLALSVPLLGESVGWRRWTAAIVGLLGVLIVVRPGSSSFQPAAVFPLTSALLWACTIIATREMSGTERPETTLSWSALVGFAALSAMVPFHWLRPGVWDIGWGLLIGTFATAGQWLMIMAYGKARAAVLAPLTYAQLIWATALGFVVFGAVPGAWTYGGAGIIAASGLYIAYREARRRGANRPPPIEPAGQFDRRPGVSAANPDPADFDRSINTESS